MIAIGRLLKSACDHHDLRGRKFVNFAMEHAKVKGKTDAYDLLKLGEIADTILADCEAKQRDNPDYFWPHWRNAIQGMKRQENRARRRCLGWRHTGYTAPCHDTDTTGQKSRGNVRQPAIKSFWIKCPIRLRSPNVSKITIPIWSGLDLSHLSPMRDQVSADQTPNRYRHTYTIRK